ncbi:hypothetical protein BASA81_004825 [Batrachochytrium salamandrivorans]|nr:hypothetical protein BASA81_004825 [Batrachochytrium salamandrivorans]
MSNKRLCSAEDETGEEEEIDVERIAKFPQDYIKRGESIVQLSFPPPLQAKVPIAFSHQIFLDGRHCGFRDLSVHLEFDGLWRCTSASETHTNSLANNEGSALNIIKTKLPQLFAYIPNSPAPKFGTLRRRVREELDLYWNEKPDCKLFERLHAMAVFYIECASQVEQFNSNWKLLTLVDSGVVMVACCTVYEFVNPIRDIKSWRICVVLVLPQMQRRGLAAELVREVYALAKEHGVTEVTVEDPCVEFSRVRHRVELELCTASPNQLPFTSLNEFQAATPSEVAKFSSQMRFSKPSAQFCFEALWRRLLLANSFAPESSDEWKVYRLRIKARMKRETVGLPDSKLYPEEFKTALQQEYLELQRQFAEL